MKIKDKFIQLEKKGEKALIIYLTGGFPSMEQFNDNINKIIEGGADIIEIGIPFSDPIADGKTIQYSSSIALSNGATLNKILDNLEKININIPMIIMSYLNPLIAYGMEKILKRLKNIGVSGLIIPDLPLEESERWRTLSEKEDINLIFLTAPTSSLERIKKITKYSKGFVYCISVKGITGERDKLPSDLNKHIQNVKKYSKVPVAVGFGISTPEQVKMLSNKADGVIIGSRVLKGIMKGEDTVNLIKNLKKATRC